MTHLLLAQANSVHLPLADQSVSMICTSPPYYGLRSYNIGAEQGELGSEALHDCGGWAQTQEPYIAYDEDDEPYITWRYTGTGGCGQCYICAMRAVARELWRVLRNDGTLFINISDSYAGSQGAGSQNPGISRSGERQGVLYEQKKTMTKNVLTSLKPKNLLGIPQRLALALQADGWIWRSDIVWQKPSCMPESTRDRPTRSHEYVLLFAKQGRYFWDGTAIAEPSEASAASQLRYQYGRYEGNGTAKRFARTGKPDFLTVNGNSYGEERHRNARSVWTIASEPQGSYGDLAHYAAFPTELASRCIKAGSSQHGVCSVPQCGAPWVRETTTEFIKLANRHPTRKALRPHADMADINSANAMGFNKVTTTGWRPSCSHRDAPVTSAVILDPFAGSSTTLIAARKLGRHAIGLDLSWDYLHGIARERLGLAALERWEQGGEARPVTYADLPLFQETPSCL